MPSMIDLPTALRSHRAVYPHGSEVERHTGFWAVRTPANPTFFWGNFLQFDAAPAAGDAERWPALFAQHIAAPQPATSHVALCWETPERGDVDGFVQQGYEYHENVVMVAPVVLPAASPAIAATLRRLRGDADWDALVEFNVRTRDAVFSEAGYRDYSRSRVAHWRRQTEAGAGVWVGAFVAESGVDTLAAALGLFAETAPGPDGLKLARYQEVGTDERWRKRGLCSALLAHAAELLAPLAIDRHVIVADEHDVARPVYAARGFAVESRWRGMDLK